MSNTLHLDTSTLALTPAVKGTVPNALASAGQLRKQVKQTTGIVDATATTIWTITVLNPPVGTPSVCRVEFDLFAWLGLGGAIDAGEAATSSKYICTVTRTNGLAAVGTLSAQLGVAAAHVAGAATVTATLSLAAVSGGNTATQTLAVQVTVTKSGGASAGHFCNSAADLFNANPGASGNSALDAGVTIL